jgi:HEAT repeat protein
VRFAVDQARWAMADANFHFDSYGLQGSYVYSTNSQSNESGRYSEALRLMDERQYDRAITTFDRAILLKGPHADGAMYHKAYCQARLGQSAEAVATLNDLKKNYPNSPYLKDARVLEVDIKKIGPDQVDDDDIKILAMMSMQNQDPEKVIPLLEGQLSKPTNSLKVKDRALYVLAGIENPKAHAILLSYAKGAGNPELQRKAIRYLGSRNQKTSTAELIDIYNVTPDIDVKLAVISAFGSSGAKSPLISIAQGGNVVTTTSGAAAIAPTPMSAQNTTLLRSNAMRGLTNIATPQEVWPLYQKEENKDLRLQWVSVFSSMGAVEQLTMIAKTDKDPAVRNRAIRALGSASTPQTTGATLVELYNTGDKDTKLAVLSALGNQSNADTLVTIARKETDKDLRLQIVKQLTEMAPRSKVAMDYLMEIIK